MIDEISGNMLQWMRGFYFVAAKGGVTQAAAYMGREQPTITRQIKSLEKELGVALFDRSSGTMALTDEGRAVLEKAISMFEVVQDLKSALGKKHPEYDGKIVIAASPKIIDSYLLPFVESFTRAHPRVTFHLGGDFLGSVVQKVESADVDFGIANIDSAPNTLACYELFEVGMILMVPRNNSCFPQKSPTLRQISEIPLILFSRTGPADSFIERIFFEAGLKPNIRVTINNFSSVKKYVTQGIGAAIVNDYGISKADKAVIKIFSLDRYFSRRKYGILLRKQKYLSFTVKEFLRTIKSDIKFS